ncbi:hypothetical protein VTN96DRAFT_2549 [Rasamsonia emersonii]
MVVMLAIFLMMALTKKAENLHFLAKNLRIAGDIFGKSFEKVFFWKEKMEKAGFINVKETVKKVPIGTWPKDPKMKEIGMFHLEAQFQGIESYTPALFSRVLGWSNTELQALLAKARNELKDRSIHLYANIYFVYGQKP